MFRVFCLLVVCLSIFIREAAAISCIKACFVDCETDDCLGVCGATPFNANLERPGWRSVECQNPNDVCAFQELNFRGVLITAPVGCLLEYVHITEQVGNLFFDDHSELYSCVGEFCNNAPLTRCRVDDAENRAIGEDVAENCVIRETEGLNRVEVNEVRAFGDTDLTTGVEQCIVPEFTQLDPFSPCISQDLTQAPTCSDVSEIDVSTQFETCGSPTASPISAPTSAPSSSPTNNPTVPPTKNPTQSPTETPTTSPTGKPIAAPTSSPSQNPTTTPTKKPTSSPIEAPTGSPSVSSAPTTKPTSAPTETELPFLEENLVVVIGGLVAILLVLLIVAVVLKCFCNKKKPVRECSDTKDKTSVYLNGTDTSLKAPAGGKSDEVSASHVLQGLPDI